jgi:competence protein ComEA
VTTGDTRRREVPQRAGQPASESGSRDRANNSGEKVNINTASQAELESLLGIGPVKAQAIIDNRPYERKEDVMNVKGIKDGTYEKIEDRITVR